MKNVMQMKLRILGLIFMIPLVLIAQKNKSNKMNIVTFNKNKNYSDVDKGFWQSSRDGNTITIGLSDNKNSKQQDYFIVNIFEIEEFQNLSNTTTEFELQRLPGTLRFKGSFSKEKGEGTFTFVRDTSYGDFVKEQGLDIKDELYYFKLFLGDISRDYITGIKAMNFKPSMRELGRLVYNDASLKYIQDVNKLFNHQIDLDMISSFASKNVSVDAIKALQDLNVSNMDLEDIKHYAKNDISAEYIAQLQKLGFEDLTFSEIKKAKNHNVTIAFIEKVKRNGEGSNQLSHYIKLKIHNKRK